MQFDKCLEMLMFRAEHEASEVCGDFPKSEFHERRESKEEEEGQDPAAGEASEVRFASGVQIREERRESKEEEEGQDPAAGEASEVRFASGVQIREVHDP
ncbi:hypothetical protein KSP39_PZI010669 [Platanthera zijinensis]|uniref:Uncharacterized protein n=1 Tax=Platanthera zijinensis TaxID=2320716 RepID=A0AAP0G6E7_9ASPA